MSIGAGTRRAILAVYVVSLIERLGASDEELRATRLGIELGGMPEGFEQEFELCKAAQSGWLLEGGLEPGLRSGLIERFGMTRVDALERVGRLIQPVPLV